MRSELVTLIYSLATLTVLFSLGWYFSFRGKMFSWLDFIWSGSFLVVIFIYHVHHYLMNGQTTLRIIDLLYALWSMRLSAHLYKRIRKSGEDRRYLKLKKKWKVWYGVNFLFLFQLEALLTIILSIPLFLTYSDASSSLQILSVIIFIVAIAGETLSDVQLATFIENNLDRTKVCDVGLWKYSRHPNYFFEWLIWISFAIYGLSSIEKWPALIPAMVMFILLTKVTGIPPAEESSLQSKKENYMAYQKRTNAFFPWFPKGLLLTLILMTVLHQDSVGLMQKRQQMIKNVFPTLRGDV